MRTARHAPRLASCRAGRGGRRSPARRARCAASPCGSATASGGGAAGFGGATGTEPAGDALARGFGRAGDDRGLGVVGLGPSAVFRSGAIERVTPFHRTRSSSLSRRLVMSADRGSTALAWTTWLTSRLSTCTLPDAVLVRRPASRTFSRRLSRPWRAASLRLGVGATFLSATVQAVFAADFGLGFGQASVLALADLGSAGPARPCGIRLRLRRSRSADPPGLRPPSDRRGRGRGSGISSSATGTSSLAAPA